MGILHSIRRFLQTDCTFKINRFPKLKVVALGIINTRQIADSVNGHAIVFILRINRIK